MSRAARIQLNQLLVFPTSRTSFQSHIMAAYQINPTSLKAATQSPPATTNKMSTRTKTTKPPTPQQPPTKRPTLIQKYLNLPLKWKLYIGVTTFIVACMADSIGNRIMEKNMIDYEANRRVEIEMEKFKQFESSKPQSESQPQPQLQGQLENHNNNSTVKR